MRKLFVIISLGLLTISISTLALTRTEKLKMFTEAERLARAGEFEKSLSILYELVKHDKNPVIYQEILKTLSDAYSTGNLPKKEFEEMFEKYLKEGIRENPREAELYKHGLNFYSWQGNRSEYLSTLQEAVSNVPDDPMFLQLMGEEKYDESKYEEAKRYLEKAVEKGGGFMSYLELGLVYTQLGDMKRASESFLQAYELNPSDPRPLIALIISLYEILDFENCYKYSVEFADKYGVNTLTDDVSVIFADTLYITHRTNELNDFIQKKYDFQNTTTAKMYINYIKGNYESAFKFGTERIKEEKKKTSVVPFLFLAEVSEKLKDVKNEWENYHFASELYLDKGKTNTAVLILEKLAREGDTLALSRLSDIWIYKGNNSKAFYYSIALFKKPPITSHYGLLSVISVGLTAGKTQYVTNLVNRFVEEVKKKSDADSALMAMAYTSYLMGGYRSDDLFEVVENEYDSESPDLVRAKIFNSMTKKEYSKAKKLCISAIKNSGFDVVQKASILNTTVHYLTFAGKLEEVNELLSNETVQAVISISWAKPPETYYLLDTLSYFYLKQGNLTKALMFSNQAIKAVEILRNNMDISDSFIINFRRAVILDRMGEKKQAVGFYVKAFLISQFLSFPQIYSIKVMENLNRNEIRVKVKNIISEEKGVSQR